MTLSQGSWESPFLGGIDNSVFLAYGGPITAQTRSTYVPAFTYSKYDCPQLVREARSLAARAAGLVGVQPSPRAAVASDDKSVVIFWPRVFSLVGDKGVVEELALMRGQMLAIEEASVQGQCSIQFQRPAT